MTITSIMLLFHLLISLFARINPCSGCSRCLEASQVTCQANRLTGFSVMGISIETSFRAICKATFFLNSILLLIPVLRLAFIFLIFMVYLLLFSLYCFSTLVCINLVGKNFGRFAYFDFRSTFIDAFSWSVQLFLTILLLTGKTFIFKDAG